MMYRTLFNESAEAFAEMHGEEWVKAMRERAEELDRMEVQRDRLSYKLDEAERAWVRDMMLSHKERQTAA